MLFILYLSSINLLSQFYNRKEEENCLQDNFKNQAKVTQRSLLLTVMDVKDELVNRAQMQQSKVYSRSTFSHKSAKLPENIIYEMYVNWKNVQKCVNCLHLNPGAFVLTLFLVDVCV